MSADWRAIIRNWDELKGLRVTREGEWQQIADYFMPRKDFVCTPVPGQLRRRRVTTSAPQVALSRFAAMLVGYLIDPTRPFIKPNVMRGMVAAGRSVDLDAAGLDYLDTVSWQMFDRMMLSQSGFYSSVSRIALELGGFGTGVLWTGRQRGFGPRYQARPLRACWIGENDEGVIDTLYFRWTLPAWKVLERYPEARKVDKLLTLASDEKTEKTPVTLLHCVEPRRGGKVGAVATNKPFTSVTIAPDYTDAVLEEGGYDSFPYAVPRLNVEEGSAYGTGLAWQALPDAMVMSSIQDDVEAGVGLRVRPPLMGPARLFNKPLDRRSGAYNVYDEAGLGFQNIKDAVQKLDTAGDVNVGVEYMNMLRNNIEMVFFTDWMRLSENREMTAEEVRERRSLRIRAMSAFVPSVDRDLMGVVADRTLTCMVEENQLAAPPQSLAGVEVDWDYAGPLAVAQQQGQADTVAQLFALAEKAKILDEGSVAVLAVEEGLRAVGEALAAPIGLFRSREEVEQSKQRTADNAQAQADAEEAAKLGAAARDGAQGINSLAAAANMQEAA